jgi:hypothetical protein
MHAEPVTLSSFVPLYATSLPYGGLVISVRTELKSEPISSMLRVNRQSMMDEVAIDLSKKICKGNILKNLVLKRLQCFRFEERRQGSG